MVSLDGLLGPGIVTVGPEGFLALSELALAATLHSTRRGVRCFCMACRAGRESERVASLPAYLALLEAEDPPDREEIRRVRSELPDRAARPAGQPWHPRPARIAGLAGQSPA
jgi:hypothetical protein